MTRPHQIRTLHDTDATITPLGRGEIYRDPTWGILVACGETVPADTLPGYSIGCIFHHLDGTGNTSMFVNEGSLTSCNFDEYGGI